MGENIYVHEIKKNRYMVMIQRIYIYMHMHIYGYIRPFIIPYHAEWTERERERERERKGW